MCACRVLLYCLWYCFVVFWVCHDYDIQCDMDGNFKLLLDPGQFIIRSPAVHSLYLEGELTPPSTYSLLELGFAKLLLVDTVSGGHRE